MKQLILILAMALFVLPFISAKVLPEQYCFDYFNNQSTCIGYNSIEAEEPISFNQNISAPNLCYSNGTGCQPSGNQSFNQSLTDSLYTNFSSFNSTQMNYSGGFISILESWLRGIITGYNYLTSELAWNGNYTIFTGLINNASYLSTFNSTYATWAYNQTTPAITDINNRFWNKTLSYNTTQINNMIINNGSYFSTYNSTYNTWAYNQTITSFRQLREFNASYNVTIVGVNVTVYNISDPSYQVLIALNNDADESSTLFKDEKGIYNGTCSGSNCPTYNSSGVIGSSYQFDGSEDFINLTSFNGSMSSFTISWWLYPYNTANYNQIISFDSGNYGTFLFQTDATGGVYCGTDVGTRFSPTQLPAGTVVPNKWNYFTYTYNGTYGFFYKNSTLLSSKAQTAPVSFKTFNIGINHANTINGKVDEFRIYNRSLSLSEVQSLYQLGAYHNTTAETGSSITWYNATFDFNESVLYAKDYRVKSLIYTGSPISESIIMKNLTSKEINDLKEVSDYDANFAPIDYSKSNIKEGQMGFSWILKAYLELKDLVLSNVQDIINIKAENQRIKNCAKEIDYKSYQECVLK